MEDQDRYIAGSFLAMSELKKDATHQARVYLIVEAPNEDLALQCAYRLTRSPTAIVQLLKSLFPWPSDTVIINHEYLDQHTNVHGMSEEGQ